MTEEEALGLVQNRLGLHEELTVVYVVDGYEASLTSADGNVTVASVKATTLSSALYLLAGILS